MTGKADRLLALYQELTPEARELMQIAAIQYGPVLPTELAKVYRDYCRALASGPELRDDLIRQQVVQLIEDGLLVRPHGQYGNRVVVDLCLLDMVHHQALRAPSYAAMTAAVFPQGLAGVERHEMAYSPWVTGRVLRSAFYEGRSELFQSVMSDSGLALTGNPSLNLLTPFDHELLMKLPYDLQVSYFTDAARTVLFQGEIEPVVYDAFCEITRQADTMDFPHFVALLDWAVARGDLATIQLLHHRTSGSFLETSGVLAFFAGDLEAADAYFAEAHARLAKQLNRRKMALTYLTGILRILLLLRHNSTAHRRQAADDISYMKQNWGKSYLAMAATLSYAVEQQTALNPFTGPRTHIADTSLCTLVEAITWAWLSPDCMPGHLEVDVHRVAGMYRRCRLDWLAEQAESVLILQHARHDELATSTVTLRETPAPKPDGRIAATGLTPLMELMRPTANWERALESLIQLSADRSVSRPKHSASADVQLVWYVEVNATHELRGVTCRLRSRLKSGLWGKGKEQSLTQLYEYKSQPLGHSFLTEQDVRVCQCVHVYDPYSEVYQLSGRHAKYSWRLADVAVALSGHPCVYFLGDDEHTVEITHRRPNLWIAERQTPQGEKIILSMDPPYDADEPNRVVALEDGPHRLFLVTFTQDDAELAKRLHNELTIPAEARARVVEVAQQLSTLVPVHSEIPIHSASVVQVDGDARPHLHLIPHADGVRVEFFVRPLRTEGPFHRPGTGAEHSLLETNGETHVARRDLVQERELAEALLKACPAFEHFNQLLTYPFFFATPGEALEMMLQLRPLMDSEAVVVHWPQGEKYNNIRTVNPHQLAITIKRDRDWFCASGKLTLDDQQQLDLMDVIARLADPNSRFIELSDGSFLALTEEFRQRLTDLASYSEFRDEDLRFPPIRLAALQDLTTTFNVMHDEHWSSYLERLSSAMIQSPEVPSTFKAELRDYQHEGFVWLARLAHWGMGACLADDMGLGKTVQALAMLVDRAKDGPALIVAPTSVTYNWLSEAMRFAPTLNVRVFGNGDRDEAMHELGPWDVVIASYGLLHNEAERFQAEAWHTVVLDEAQAIKNTATKRSQAAMGLQADFRIVLTGTPLENHLGELWNLFQFINPGLLGPWKMFQDRFAVPIERDRCRDARRRLKNLIAPFILRRTKSQVLKELPPRTEVTMQVEMSRDEAVFYEALRRSALDRLSSVTPEDRGQHMRILGEIMRLRRACCHPQLVSPNCSLTGSKLALFLETVDELLQSDHKALVFSQFVDHLSIMRRALDAKGINYQYLDGSTPAKDRRRRVDAFQAGEGDLFLISLKAGGLGLNLTAADYVLHMDPWWNPAVEDQASDRAHRLGQLRPVTIYRFITTGTIEEQILELHGTKRDLADSLLDGTDVSGKLTTEELLRLLRTEDQVVASRG